MRITASFYAALFISVIFSACTPLAPADTHNSRNALDWAGAYRGIIPCADCEGIETVVTLNADGSYLHQSRYLGKESKVFSHGGAFIWSDDGGSVMLGENGTTVRYRVGENRLIMLDSQGEAITGALAGHYVLAKQPPTPLLETYWKLTELLGKPVSPSRNEAHIILKRAADAPSADGKGRVIGSGGCNRLMGSYTLTGPDRIHFSQMAGTMMACIEGMDTERRFHDMLGKADSYVINGNQLQLNRARMTPLAKLEAVYLY